MRDIRFRAFDDGKMVYSHNNLWNHTNFQNEWFFQTIRQDAIIMQYTGLKDKNSKDIYEGDVVEWWDSLGVSELGNDSFSTRSEVSFNNGMFEPVCWLIPDQFEVIGNIHENPELLK